MVMRNIRKCAFHVHAKNKCEGVCGFRKNDRNALNQLRLCFFYCLEVVCGAP